MEKNIFQKSYIIFQAIVALSSPFVIIMLLLATFVVGEDFFSHRRFVEKLKTIPIEGKAVVSSVFVENDRVFVRVDDDEHERLLLVEMKFYDKDLIDRFSSGDNVEIVYLAAGIPGGDKAVLKDFKEQVLEYNSGFEDNKLLFFALVCIIILILKPQILYVWLHPNKELGDEVFKP